jgi:hypothetical protein
LEYEYPKKWPELLPKLVGYLNSKDAKSTYGALYAIRMIVRRYEYQTRGKRQPLEELVAMIFPGLLGFLGALSQQSSVQTDEMLLLIIKSFWSAVNVRTAI